MSEGFDSEKFSENKDVDFYNKELDSFISLPYHLKAGITSEDPSFPLNNIQIKDSNDGWISEQNCTFPQKIIIKFKKYVDLKQINIIINENKIPTIIQFINCILINENKIKNDYKYENIGYIRLSSNENTNYNSRELRKIKVDAKNVKRLKILIHENYVNSLNEFNQVGIIQLELIGKYTDIIYENFENINTNKSSNEEKNENEKTNNNELNEDNINNKKINKNDNMKKIKLINIENKDNKKKIINKNENINEKEQNFSNKSNNNKKDKININSIDNSQNKKINKINTIKKDNNNAKNNSINTIINNNEDNEKNNNINIDENSKKINNINNVENAKKNNNINIRENTKKTDTSENSKKIININNVDKNIVNNSNKIDNTNIIEKKNIDKDSKTSDIKIIEKKTNKENNANKHNQINIIDNNSANIINNSIKSNGNISPSNTFKNYLSNDNNKYINYGLKPVDTKNKYEIKEKINSNNNKNLIELIIEKIKILKEQLKIKKLNNEYKEYSNIENEIESLEKLLKKLYNVQSYKQSAQNNIFFLKNNLKLNNRNLSSISRNKNTNFSLSNKNKEKLILSPITRKNSTHYLLSFNNNNNKIKLQKGQLNLLKSQKIGNRQKEAIYNIKLSYDNLNINGNDIDLEALEELSPEIKSQNEFLINILGEDIIQKLYSKNLYYKEEGFRALNMRVYDIIIFCPESAEETNKYLSALINIFLLFFDDDNPKIILNCIDLFMNIIKAIEEKKYLNKIDYSFQISRPIIKKIKDKLSFDSDIIRDKLVELYCYILNSNLNDYNSLIIELVDNEVNEYFSKLNINKNNLNLKINSHWNALEIFRNKTYLKFDKNKNSIISKMNIFLNIFSNYIKFEHKKFDINKFPKDIVGDFIIMNINYPNREVKDITQKVLVKYIEIFGNNIFYKINLIIGKRNITNLIQNNNELMKEFRKYENKRYNDEKEEKGGTSHKNLINSKLPRLDSLKIERNNNTNNKNTFYSPKNLFIKNNNKNQNSNLNRIASQAKLNGYNENEIRSTSNNKEDNFNTINLANNN